MGCRVESAGIKKDQLRSADIDDIPASLARFFPLEGGLAEAASWGRTCFRRTSPQSPGRPGSFEMLENLKAGSTIRLFEALFCPGGCISGACFGDGKDVFRRRNRVLQHQKRSTRSSDGEEFVVAMQSVDLRREINESAFEPPDMSEEAIRAVLVRTGKATSGGRTQLRGVWLRVCRDNAVAVLGGMAEHTMCIPWMRKVAERKNRSDY